MMNNLLTIKDLNGAEIMELIDSGLKLKANGPPVSNPLAGKTLGLIFNKASTRTRVSFETAMFRLGGQTLFLNRADTQMDRDETMQDTVRVLSRYLEALAVRTFAQDDIEEMARWSDIPIINALTDLYHPCQALSDLMTVKEKKGGLDGLKIAWIGDGNNVANSWINACHLLGIELVLACPKGYHPDPMVLESVTDNIKVVEDPEEAASGADIINTDVWTSMGQEKEKDERRKVFSRYQVNKKLLSLGKRNAIVMHCLPAHRGEEITDDVMEGPQSVVFDQAENKLYLHQAILFKLLGPE